jgi:hypothetical protein
VSFLQKNNLKIPTIQANKRTKKNKIKLKIIKEYLFIINFLLLFINFFFFKIQIILKIKFKIFFLLFFYSLS